MKKIKDVLQVKLNKSFNSSMGKDPMHKDAL